MISQVIQWTLAATVVAWLISSLAVEFRTQTATDEPDIATFGKLPVSYDGRFKPMDTVARNALMIFGGRSYVDTDQGKMTASQWLLELKSSPAGTPPRAIFRIDHPELKSLLGIDDTDDKRFSFQQIQPRLGLLKQAAGAARNLDKADRSAFQSAALDLDSNVRKYLGFEQGSTIHTVPANDLEADWHPLAAAPHAGAATHADQSVSTRYRAIFAAYAAGDVPTYNREVTALHEQLEHSHAEISRKAVVEWHFNHFNPFQKTLVLYIAGGLLVILSWMFLPETLLKSALKIIAIAFVVHTLALVVRIYLSGRPPVTNLYSSAVYVGWGVVGLSFLIEALLNRGLGLIVGITAGVATLLIAQSLSADGDTMAVLQAVLDTNLWLATHVIVITKGYVAAFVAGGLGIVYIAAASAPGAMDKKLARRLSQAIYGTVCFALLLSFVGTILGGIWADQSWGRFWGWDPKENGALMIVIWNAIILHARWGGMVRERGLAVLAVLGNIVVAWSWFGVNMLGAGLHSYGFAEAGEGNFIQRLVTLDLGPKEWLILFVLSQLVIACLGMTPLTERRKSTPPRTA